MVNIAVIILSKNEKLHIRRCLEKLAPLEPQQIFVVDCFSTAGTQVIVRNWENRSISPKWDEGGKCSEEGRMMHDL